MKKIQLLLLVLFACTPFSSAQKSGELDLREVVGGKYYPQYIYGVNPMNDGESYSQLSDDGTQILKRSFKTGEVVETLFDVSLAKGPVSLKSISGYTMSPDETRILLCTERRSIYRRSYTAVYYIYDIRSKRFSKLSDGGPQQQPLFSPDGTQIAFVREGNLFLVKLLFNNAESQITKDGEFNKIINGLPDWVYEEEFTTARSFDFSADSKLLAWIRYDESAVSIYSMQEFKGLVPEKKQFDTYPGSFDYKYPVAGAVNSTVSVLTHDIKHGVTRKVDLPLEADGYIPRLKFTSKPEQLAIVTLNRQQNQMDIYMANPLSGVCRLAVRETNERYVTEAAYESLTFYKDHFAYLSDRDGYKHIYLYNMSGQLLRQVTKGDYDVTKIYGYDEAADRFYYAARPESPLRSGVYSIDKKGNTRKITSKQGINDATFSKSLKYFMNVYSSASQPPVTALCESGSGKVVRTLVDNASLKGDLQNKQGGVEFFTFRNSAGVELHGYMVKPRNFDSGKKYPVVMYQYSGPGSQEVKDAWNIGFMPGATFESYLAQRGFVAVCVDGRGTGFRGADFEKCTYMKLGNIESSDQVEAALYLATLPFVDKERIGIWGWSFGGFNTLMAMSDKRQVFRAGVAVAAPTNWKYYDTVYTERYMRTPKENVSGYACNPIELASQLSGKLLLIHGTADDNVHFRNFTEYSEALVQANKQFEQQIYTNRNHSIFGGNTRYHLFSRIVDFFERNLK